ncbi:hypothetical protein GS504_01735 [Rhodococcus hoagii]|nr:hypothetical protein [Prescottella equi]NKS74828.1 hypothetical protein [Prescottella equi]
MMNNGYMFDAVHGGYVIAPGYCRCGNRHDMWTPCTNFDLEPPADPILCACGEIHERDENLCPFAPAPDAEMPSHLKTMVRPAAPSDGIDLPAPLSLPDESEGRIELPPPLQLPEADTESAAAAPPPDASAVPASRQRRGWAFNRRR